MAIFKLFPLFLSLFTVINLVNTQQLYPQVDEIVSLKSGNNYFSNNNYGAGINLQDHHFSNYKSRSYSDNDYGQYLRNVPLYTEKKVTTIRKLPPKKQSSKAYNNIPSFNTGHFNKGKSSYNTNQGYNNKISLNGNGRNHQIGSHVNWFKGNNIKKNIPSFDIAKTVNDFNKQIEQLNNKAFSDSFKQEHAPQINTHHSYKNVHSFNDNNKQPFDYIPVNLDAKINTNHAFNFNSDINLHNYGLNNHGNKINTNNLFSTNSELKTNNFNHGIKTIDLSTDKFTQNSNFKSGWNYKPEPVKSQPVKYETFVPGINVFDSSSGKTNHHNTQSLEHFHSHGKGGDPSSFVHVTNGKVSYNYHIKHLPIHHH